MDTAQIISILISVAAFGVAAYGIIERRVTASRSERVRLTTIVENMAKIREELVDLTEHGITSGSKVEVISARLEILAQQAISLVQQHSLTITSTECREIAIGLEQAGFVDDAEFMWNMAHERAQKEGDIQEFYANRGHAYFLIRSQHEAEAREMLREALNRYTADNDTKRLAHAETLTAWIVWETAQERTNTQIIGRLKEELTDLRTALVTSRGREMFDNTVRGVDTTSIENSKS